MERNFQPLPIPGRYLEPLPIPGRVVEDNRILAMVHHACQKKREASASLLAAQEAFRPGEFHSTMSLYVANFNFHQACANFEYAIETGKRYGENSIIIMRHVVPNLYPVAPAPRPEPVWPVAFNIRPIPLRRTVPALCRTVSAPGRIRQLVAANEQDEQNSAAPAPNVP